jgi:hypothetical protein
MQPDYLSVSICCTRDLFCVDRQKIFSLRNLLSKNWKNRKVAH